jgi:hypothetical protein
MAILALLYLFFIFVFFVVGVGGTILWVWAIIDCASHEPSAGNDKIVWLLVIIFLHVIGAGLYLLVRRPQRIRELGR